MLNVACFRNKYTGGKSKTGQRLDTDDRNSTVSQLGNPGVEPPGVEPSLAGPDEHTARREIQRHSMCVCVISSRSQSKLLAFGRVAKLRNAKRGSTHHRDARCARTPFSHNPIHCVEH